MKGSMTVVILFACLCIACVQGWKLHCNAKVEIVREQSNAIRQQEETKRAKIFAEALCK
jgi:hypothetical protein